MARRKKASGKAATKAKTAKVANGLVTVPVRKNDSDESGHSQDIIDVQDPAPNQTDDLPTDFERANSEEPSLQSVIEELAPQSSPISIVHKKFGKFQCVVETVNTVVHKGKVGNENVDVQEEGCSIEVIENEEEMSQVLWEEEVIEETIISEDVEMDEEVSDPEIHVNKDVYQSAARHMAFEEEWNSRYPNAQNDVHNIETATLCNDSVVPKQEGANDAGIHVKPPVASSARQESLSKNSVTIQSRLGALKSKNEESDVASTSESEVTSREEDSQDSQKTSGSDPEGFLNQTNEELKNTCSQIILGISNESCSQDSTSLHKNNLAEAFEEIKLVEDKRHLRSAGRPSNVHHQLYGDIVRSPKVKKKSQQAIALAAAAEDSLDNVCEPISSKYSSQHTEFPGIYNLSESAINQDEDLQATVEHTDELAENIEPVESGALSLATETTLVYEPKVLKRIEEEVDSKPQTPAFRSRSGSTDTTGSESSCSSNIRRSTRIRSISITKQRTRSRFEALNIASEDTKVAESRDSSDNNSGAETQSDREGISLKVPVPMSSQGISAPPGIKHLDLNFKPVKVKSRWRRSSELEMVGNRSSDSDVAATPPTPSHSPLLIAPRTLTMSPRPATYPVASAPLASPTPTAMIVDESPIVAKEVTPKKDPRTDKKVKEDKEMEERLRQFENLTENHYLTERSTSREFRGMVCDCFLTKDELARGELGCGEDCLNRLLMIECGSRCTLGDRCSNKHFQKQEYSKCEVFKTEKKGYGLRATADLPQGAFLLEYVGEVVNAKEFRRRAKEYSKDKNRHYYFMALKSDSIIDATMKGNISRFINHSCDPNAETQKWTVNGELRIGFFTTRSLAAWEELTFDYQFQRYGKEAQRCHCESSLCRGWIGEDPEKEKEKEDSMETDRDFGKKNQFAVEVEEEEDSDEIDDTLEEDIGKLCASGLKNRNHTLTLCRLMVRGQDTNSRIQLLQLLQRGEQACLRLFLDYHGLRLIWKWMSDASRSADGIRLRTEILRTLSKLPILNKTVLQDSKVLSVVEKWVEAPPTGVCQEVELKQEGVSPEEGSQDSEQAVSTPDADAAVVTVAVGDPDAEPGTDEIADKVAGEVKEEEEEEEDTMASIQEFNALAMALLAVWSNLKEVFRIPKKERIEQMKEHEREADRGYKEYLDKEDSRSNKQSYDRHWRQRSADNDKARDRKKIISDTEKIRKSRFEDRCIVQMAGLSKEERRQMFAEKVAKEEEEERHRKIVEEEEDRQRKSQEEHWRVHEEQCRALDMDPMATVFDWDTGGMAVFDALSGAWIRYPHPDQQSDSLPQDGATGQMYNPHGGGSQEYDPNHPMNVQFNVGHSQFDPNHPLNTQMNPDLMNSQYNPNPIHDLGPSKPEGSDEICPPLPSELYQILLPPKWVTATDDRGFTYYYHKTERTSRWDPPWELMAEAAVDVDSASDGSDEEEEDELESPVEEDDDLAQEGEQEVEGAEEEGGEDTEEMPLEGGLHKEELGKRKEMVEDEVISGHRSKKKKHALVQYHIIEDNIAVDENSPGEDEDESVAEAAEDLVLPENEAASGEGEFPEVEDTPELEMKRLKLLEEKDDRQADAVPEEVKKKERREGLVQERIISPRCEADRPVKKNYRVIKEKLRRKKDQARKARSKKKRHERESKPHTSRKAEKPPQADAADTSTEAARKIKDHFRLQMAGAMVQFLNPYRKPDCTQGRITNTEDFKHLARKLTLFVMLKELKHCQSVDDLVCNDSVKHKARDFIRKYMSKFGTYYQRPIDDD